MEFLPINPFTVDLACADEGLVVRHQFEPRQLKAINAALSASRPLLVRGEPGVGKSQSARAAAKALGRVFVQHVVDAGTESRDLLWHFDAVGRFAKAQVMGALQIACAEPDKRQSSTRKALDVLDDELAVEKFLHPRALWWAFDWAGAMAQATTERRTSLPSQADGGNSAWERGCVVLIDEIDKAEPGCAERLAGSPWAAGSHATRPKQAGESNRSRSRWWSSPPTKSAPCQMPSSAAASCCIWICPKTGPSRSLKLIERGNTHFAERASSAVLEMAAKLLADDRAVAEQRHWRPLPGQAEYLDLVRSVVVQSKGDFALQDKLIEQVAQFVLKKHPEAARELPEDDGL